jgi:uncharacterized membrane protein
MTFSWDMNPATLLIIAVQIVGFIVFVVRTHNRATEADEAACKAQKRADEAVLNTSAVAANLSLFREQVAAEYVDRDALREIKRELIDAINRLGDRMDASMRTNGHK